MSRKLKIKQIRSSIGCLKNQKLTIRALGIRKIGQTVLKNDNPAIRGMVTTVHHLVTVEEIEE